MQCEYCASHHESKYGSGRFCNQKCARAFSSKAKREEINKKVSETLKGRPSKGKGKPGKKHSEATIEKLKASLKKHYEDHPQKTLTLAQRRARNVAKVIAYRARKRNALRKDTDLGLIRKIYELCPEGYHVDHIHALSQGGAHHQDNLQYLPASENHRKCAGREYDVTSAIDWRTLVIV